GMPKRGLDGANPICLLRPNVPIRTGARRGRKMGMMLGHNRKMLGAECMADMLEAYGVTHVFHVPAVLRKTFAVMERPTKIKRLHVHSEATAAYMADGYARA